MPLKKIPPTLKKNFALRADLHSKTAQKKSALRADIFLKNNFHLMPVISGKKLVGKISKWDIIRSIQDSTNYDMNSKEINGI